MLHGTFNQLELLSNEILIEVLEYLDAYTLCSTFYGLNQRLNDLLRLCRLNVCFDKYKRNKNVWNTLTTFVNPAQIRTLSMDGVAIHEWFLPSNKENLHSIYFYRMKNNSIDMVLQHLPPGSTIKTLCINQKVTASFYDSNPNSKFPFDKHGHRLTSLVYCSLKLIYGINFSVPTVIFSKLRYLSLENYFWSPHLVQFLQENTPNLRSLYFRGRFFDTFEIPSYVIRHIQELDINFRGKVTSLEDLLSKFPSLKRLHIQWENSIFIPTIDGTQYQMIIQKHLPLLQQLTVSYDGGVNEDIVKTFYGGTFWSTKRVAVKMMINTKNVLNRQVKTICYGKQWHFGYFKSIRSKARREDPRTLLPRSRSFSSQSSWDESSLQSPLHLRSRSQSRPRLQRRSQTYRRSRSDSQPRTSLGRRRRSRSDSRPQSRLRHQRRSRSDARLRHRRRSRSNSRPQSRLRHRRRSRSDSRPQSRLRHRRRSRSDSRPQSRLRHRRRSRSDSRPQSRLRHQRRSRSDVRVRHRRRSRSNPRPQPRLRHRRLSRSESRLRSQLRSQPTRRSRPYS